MEFIAAAITFGCATSAVVFPAGELGWYDFVIVVAVIAFVLDILFVASYFFERRNGFLPSTHVAMTDFLCFFLLFSFSAGWEWCFDPLRARLPLVEFVITLLWSVFWLICAIVFASNYSSIFDIVPGKRALDILACAFPECLTPPCLIQ